MLGRWTLWKRLVSFLVSFIRKCTGLLKRGGGEEKSVNEIYLENKPQIDFLSAVFQPIPPARRALYAFNLLPKASLYERLVCVALVAYLTHIRQVTQDVMEAAYFLFNPPSEIYLSDRFPEPVDFTLSVRDAFKIPQDFLAQFCDECNEELKFQEVLSFLSKYRCPVRVKVGVAYLVGEVFASHYFETERERSPLVIEGQVGMA